MLTKIASASVLALATTQAKDNWIHDELHDLLYGKKI